MDISFIEKSIQMKNKIFQITMILMAFNGLFIKRVENLLLSVFYVWVPFFILFYVFRGTIILKKEQKQFIVFSLYSIFSIIINFVLGSTFAIFSILHFLFFIAIGFALLNLIDGKKETIINISKIVIIFYFFHIMISLILNVLDGRNILPEFILRIVSQSSEPFGFSFFRIWEAKTGEGAGIPRYCGLAIEPSYLALYITACMLAIIQFMPILNKRVWLYLLFYTLTILISKTSFGMIGLILVYMFLFIKFLFHKLKGRGIKIFACIAIPVFSVLFLLLIRNNYYVVRIYNLLQAMSSSSSIEKMYYSVGEAESSGFFRVMPPILYFSRFNITSLNSWFGYGPSAHIPYLEDMGFSIPFFPGAIHAFGLLGAGYFLYFIFSLIKNLPIVFHLFILVCLTNSSYSTQLFWFLIIHLICVAKANNDQTYSFSKE
jgi:hypothetical protein